MMLSNIHQIISNNISYLLHNMYYKYINKIYNNDLNNIFKYYKFPIVSPELFIYLQYYFIYAFFYYLTHNNIILYSITLHLPHICGLIFKDLTIKYDYKPINNAYFLKNTNYLLFTYLFLLKIYLYKKFYILYGTLLFYTFLNINHIYVKRLESIVKKKEIDSYLKFLIISPNRKFINDVIYSTSIFTYSNYLLFINIFKTIY